MKDGDDRLAAASLKKRSRHSLPATRVTKQALSTPAHASAKRVSSAPKEQTVRMAKLAASVEASPLSRTAFSNTQAGESAGAATVPKNGTLKGQYLAENPGISMHDAGLPRFTEDEDDVDEISLLGLAAIEHTYSRHGNRASTPENYLDDMNMKIESPANLSIGKLFEEDEPVAENGAQFEMSLKAKTEPYMDAILENQFGKADAQEPPRLSTVENTAMHDTLPQTSMPTPPSEAERSITPDRGLAALPYAEEEYINTPARPVEDAHLMQYFNKETPKRSVNAKLVQRTPPHKEDAFLHALKEEQTIPVGHTETPLIADVSFTSTTADLDLDHDAQTLLNAEQADFAMTEHTLPAAQLIEGPVLSTPQTNEVVHRNVTRDSGPNGILGSAIRLDGSINEMTQILPHRLGTPVLLADEETPKPVRYDGSHVLSRSEPRTSTTRLATPPPRSRLSMDIPLSRSLDSVEVWGNTNVQTNMSTKTLPATAAEHGSIRTPSPKLRMNMDVPLSREQPATEIWDVQPIQRPRRSLAAAEPRKRFSPDAQLMVEESPQASAKTSAPAGQLFTSTPLPGMPKLNFGMDVQHSHSLSDSEDIESPESRSAIQSDHLEPMIDASLTRDVSEADGQERSNKRRSLLKFFTPRSSKLRQLAHHLAEAKENLIHGRAEIPSPPQDQSTPASSIDAAARKPVPLTPRSALRKQLSDDIDLDFAPEAAPMVHIPQETDILPAQQGDQSRRDMQAFATPVFTSKRRRKSPSPIPDFEVADVLEPANPPPIQATTKKARPRGKAEPKMLKLATFGVAPQVLPRSRRERKKPAEFWKVQDDGIKEEDDPAPSILNAQPKQQKRPRAPEHADEEGGIAKKPKKNGKHRKRPGDFTGPLSAHRKIKARPTSS